MITQKTLKELLHYNPASGVFIRVSAPNNGCKEGDTAGTIKKSGRTKYIMISAGGIRRPAQQFAFLYMTGKFPIGVIDHIDGNGLNNKWDNLRDVSHQDNCRNQKLRFSNNSGFMGVQWRNDQSVWRVRINHDGKRINLGQFTALSDAVFARLNAEKEYGYHINHGAR